MPLKTKQKRQASSDLVGFFLRVPSDIKARLDQKSKELGRSQAAVCVELIRAGLDGATVSTVSTLSTEGAKRNLPLGWIALNDVLGRGSTCRQGPPTL
jgi:hypothetical protein